MKKPKNYIIDVVPLTRITLAKQQFFSYLWDKKVPAGSLVTIPLSRRNAEGIVIRSHLDFERLNGIRLKTIGNIIETGFLTPDQLELAKFISEYYFCPLGVVLKFFVPRRVKMRDKQPATYHLQQKRIKLTKEQQDAVKKIVTRHDIQDIKFLLFGPASSGKTEVYINAISKIKARNTKTQFLVLLPELTLTPQAVERYGTIFKPEEIAVIHSKISKGQLYDYWQKIKSGKIKLIIGTRMAVFAPFNNLKLIVVDEEQDISFKQWDMNPRYDVRTVAEKLAELHNAKIVRGSATPSIESYYKALNNKYKLLQLSRLQVAGYKLRLPEIEIVDMRKERWIKNYSPISQKLQSEITYALKNKQQIILFINRQGVSAFSVCERCKSILRCPKCERALIYENNGKYRCLHCAYKAEVFITCRNCKSMSFRNFGLGTQKVEREIEKLFPQAKTLRVDTETTKKINQKKIYQDFSSGKYDILIGTQMITKGWDNPRVSLIGIIDTDNLFSFPDLRSDEYAFQHLVQAAGRTSRPRGQFPGKVILQTFNPSNSILRTVAQMDYNYFYKKEVKEREILNYLPFSRIIKLIIQHYSHNKVCLKSDELFKKLINISEKNSVIEIVPPHEPLVSKSRGRFRRQILIKIKDEKQNIPRKIRHILESLDKNWIIDVDPVNTA